MFSFRLIHFLRKGASGSEIDNEYRAMSKVVDAEAAEGVVAIYTGEHVAADGIGGPEGGGAPGGMGEQNGTPEAFMPLSYVVISELLNRVHCVTMGSLPPSVTSEAVLVNSFHLKYLKVQPWQAPNA